MSDDMPETLADKRCRNCDAVVSGLYCAHCGQPEGRSDLHFSEAVGDLFGDVFAWDSRFWRTMLALLFKPGFVSAEFNAGRRARYMPPFRMYISISFLVFLLLSLSAGNVLEVSQLEDREGDESLVIGLDPNDVTDDVRERIEDARARATEEVERPPSAPNAKGAPEAVSEERRQNSVLDLDLDEDAPEWLRALEARLETNAVRVGDDPTDFVDELVEYLPQAMFVMLPFFALLLKMVYLFRPFHYLQHLVFALHYHSFVYLLYMISEALEWMGFALSSLLFLLLVAYLPLALRTCYQSSWVGAISRSALLYVVYGIALLLGMVVVALGVLALM